LRLSVFFFINYSDLPKNNIAKLYSPRNCEGLVMLDKVFGATVLCAAIYLGVSALDTMSSKPTAIPEASANSDPSAPRRVNDNVTAFSTSDPAMNAAKAKARETLPRFEAMVQNNHEGTYSVKFPMTQNGQTEHIWLQVEGVSTDTIVGRLANKPIHGNQYRMGQTMVIQKAQVEDWMIRSDNGMWGVYTARAALAAANDDQSKAMLAMFKD
jgi:uncharacterized protein YegJ (DUF2314 family)